MLFTLQDALSYKVKKAPWSFDQSAFAFLVSEYNLLFFICQASF